MGTVVELKARYARLCKKYVFQPGDIVQWKAGLRNKSSEGLFVVIEVLDAPVLDTSCEAGSAYFREPLDLLLGLISHGGDFLLYHYDSRRFEPVE